MAPLMRISGVCVFLGWATACGGAQSESEAPAAPEATSDATPEPDDAPAEVAPPPPELTAEQCEERGGTVVGDIGDGAIHRPEYRCPSGAAPSGAIRAPEGGPMGVEGSVCCPG